MITAASRPLEVVQATSTGGSSFTGSTKLILPLALPASTHRRPWSSVPGPYYMSAFSAAVCEPPRDSGVNEWRCGGKRDEDVFEQSGRELPQDEAAERITGFDQAPDFIIPDEFNPPW